MCHLARRTAPRPRFGDGTRRTGPPLAAIRNERILLGSRLAFVVVFFAGTIVAGWVPPLTANHTADGIAQMYRDGAGSIRAGALLIGASTLFQGVWAALISVQMQRIEHGRPLLTYLQLGGGAVGIWFGICTHVLRRAINAEAEEPRAT